MSLGEASPAAELSWEESGQPRRVTAYAVGLAQRARPCGPCGKRVGMEPRNGQLGDPGAREGGSSCRGPPAWGASHLWWVTRNCLCGSRLPHPRRGPHSGPGPARLCPLLRPLPASRAQSRTALGGTKPPATLPPLSSLTTPGTEEWLPQELLVSPQRGRAGQHLRLQREEKPGRKRTSVWTIVSEKCKRW